MSKKWMRIYLRVVETICVVLIALILSLLVIQIVCRLGKIGQNFTEEASRLCFSLMIFIGAPMVLAEGSDIAVDMVVNALPKGARRAINILVNLFIILFCGMCLYGLVPFIAANQGISAVSITWIQMNWIYATVFVSILMLAIVAMIKMIALFQGEPDTVDINAEAKALARKEEEGMDIGI